MRPTHWIIVILVVIIIFGASKLPDIARNLGKSAKILKKEMRELQDDPADSGQHQPYNPPAQQGQGPYGPGNQHPHYPPPPGNTAEPSGGPPPGGNWPDQDFSPPEDTTQTP